MKSFLARQLALPHGWFGRLFGARLLNIANKVDNQATMQQLNIQFHDYVLDIGFGGGTGLRAAWRQANQGFVAGIDPSQAMIDQAQRLFSAQIAAGQVEIKRGSAEAIPYAESHFDKVFTVNTIYFWPDTVASFEEIWRVLKPEGRLCITIIKPEVLRRLDFDKHGFTPYEPQEVSTQVEAAAFKDVAIQDYSDQLPKPVVCITASK